MEDFTFFDYGRLLERLRNFGYSFVFPPVRVVPEDSRICFLRHDIDASVMQAFKMAEIEEKRGISATYCVRLRGGFYNLFGSFETDIIRKIRSAGHHIGLHFDLSVYSKNLPADLSIPHVSALCEKERKVLEDWFGVTCRFISFHKPGTLEMSGGIQLSEGRQHSFMPVFINDMSYFADSYGFWRYGNPLDSDAFRSGAPLHLNVHPEWWWEVPRSSVIKVNDLVKERLNQMRSELMWDIVGV
jgi:hypothetical protein